jgi:hypothetical protein
MQSAICLVAVPVMLFVVNSFIAADVLKICLTTSIVAVSNPTTSTELHFRFSTPLIVAGKSARAVICVIQYPGSAISLPASLPVAVENTGMTGG